MKRLWRSLSNALTVLSLILCICTLWMWTRSDDPQGWYRVVGIGRLSRPIGIGGAQGTLVVGRWKDPTFQMPLTPYIEPHQFGSISRTRFECFYLPFAALFDLFILLPLLWLLPWGRRALRRFLPGDANSDKHRLVRMLAFLWTYVNMMGIWNNVLPRVESDLPYISMFILAAPLFYWLVAKKKAPRKIGLCSACGYDLRATPDRCPECGTIPTKATA